MLFRGVAAVCWDNSSRNKRGILVLNQVSCCIRATSGPYSTEVTEAALITKQLVTLTASSCHFAETFLWGELTENLSTVRIDPYQDL
jgi:hypothetical protein